MCEGKFQTVNNAMSDGVAIDIPNRFVIFSHKVISYYTGKEVTYLDAKLSVKTIYEMFDK